MRKLESIREKDMHKNLRDFVKQTNPLIRIRRPDLVFINKRKTKKKLSSNGFSHSGEPQNKRKRKICYIIYQ